MDIHIHVTRQQNKLHIPKCRTSVVQKAIRCYCGILRNWFSIRVCTYALVIFHNRKCDFMGAHLPEGVSSSLSLYALFHLCHLYNVFIVIFLFPKAIHTLCIELNLFQLPYYHDWFCFVQKTTKRYGGPCFNSAFCVLPCGHDRTNRRSVFFSWIVKSN